MYAPRLLLLLVIPLAPAVAQQPEEGPPKPAADAKRDASARPAAGDGYVPYEAQDLRLLFEVEKGEEGKARATIHIERLGKFVDRLGAHARNYPVRFRSAAEKQLAIDDVTRVSGVLAKLLGGGKPDAKVPSGLLLHAGQLEAIGHNLDIDGSAARATAYYERLLQQEPQHALGNLHFGMFLGGTATRGKDAIPFLEKAAAAGEVVAHRGLGVVHMTLGDKAKALEHLRQWSAANPDDTATKELIKAIESGAPVEVKKQPAPGDRRSGDGKK